MLLFLQIERKVHNLYEKEFSDMSVYVDAGGNLLYEEFRR